MIHRFIQKPESSLFYIAKARDRAILKNKCQAIYMMPKGNNFKEKVWE